jgi:phosphoribosylglycinamide formyltransferase 1
MKSIVIFASGSGTNAEKIINYFHNNAEITVSALFTDKPDCGAALIAGIYGLDKVVFNKKELAEGVVLTKLRELNPDLIVLAGFLKLLPVEIIRSFKEKIINIHPALLPKYGGKGFYGKFVHEAVLKAKENKSGITIHLVDEEYDRGRTLLQKECDVSREDTPVSLAERVRRLEHKYYPLVIEEILKKGNT